MCVDNIISVYSKAHWYEVDSGKTWYKDARSFCKQLSKEKKIPLGTVVGVVAALSPRNRWDRNKWDAEALITAYRNRVDLRSIPVATFNSNRDKAIEILEGADPMEVLGGNKVRAFFDNIYYLDSSSRVTVDTHAISIYNGTRTKAAGLSDKKYSVMESAYREAADRVAVHPIEMQAITWITWKRLEGI